VACLYSSQQDHFGRPGWSDGFKGDSVTAIKRFALIGLAVAGLMAFSTPAQASVVIDFGTGTGTGGTVTALANGQYSGTAIPVAVMQVSGTSAMDGVYTTTGTAGGFASLNFNTATNTISITGGIASPLNLASQTLLSGTFTNFTFSVLTPPSLGGVAQFTASGFDEKSVELLRALGIPITTQFQFFTFQFLVNWNGATGTSTGLLALATVVRRRYARS
jgi:hypothetical protein